MEQNRTTPTEFQKTVGVNLCLLRCIYTFADSRGRLSLQGEIKLPYEKKPFRPLFLIGTVNKDKSEPHCRVIRFGFFLSPPEFWVPTLSAGAGNRGLNPYTRFARWQIQPKLLSAPIKKRGFRPLFLIGAVSDDKSEPNASSISAKVIVFVPSL